jgi:hypothetical protein
MSAIQRFSVIVFAAGTHGHSCCYRARYVLDTLSLAPSITPDQNPLSTPNRDFN